MLPDPPRGSGASTASATPLQFEGDPPRNLLFLSVDTLRKDHLGFHDGVAETPFLKCLAEQSVVLDDHLQCSNWTFGSTTCTLSGRTNIELGTVMRLVGGEDNRAPIPEGTPFLATWLGQAGIRSALSSTNSWLGDKWGNGQGFDKVVSPLWYTAGRVAGKGKGAIDDLVDDRHVDPWFLHLHFMEPHAAYDPGAAYLHGLEELEPWPVDLGDRDDHYDARNNSSTLTPDERNLLEAHLRLRYRGEVEKLDAEIANVWAGLETEGWLDDTLVVLWSDHGEQFWEHGDQTHAYTLHAEETDGVAVFWAKNLVPGRWSGPTASIDLVPTVLDVLGVDMPPQVTGVPLGLAAEDRIRFGEAFARRGGVQYAVKDGFKLHYRWNGAVKAYDRTIDPMELTDVFDSDDPRVLELWDALVPQIEAMEDVLLHGDQHPVWPPSLPR